MQESGRPTSRFDLVSKGFGKVAGGVVQLVIGVIVLFFNRDIGLILMLLGVITAAMGAYSIFSGASAPQKEIKCPHCGESNTLLTDVKEFTCYNCNKSLKLVRR